MALIGAVALIVIGPEKLPRVARTVGTLLGKAQRYVADIKQEVNRAIEIDELQKMKSSVEDVAREFQRSVQTAASDISTTWAQATNLDTSAQTLNSSGFPVYQHPQKKWRLKQSATPRWFKTRTGMRTHAMSGAARVARFRPKPAGRPPV